MDRLNGDILYCPNTGSQIIESQNSRNYSKLTEWIDKSRIAAQKLDVTRLKANSSALRSLKMNSSIPVTGIPPSIQDTTLQLAKVRRLLVRDLVDIFKLRKVKRKDLRDQTVISYRIVSVGQPSLSTLSSAGNCFFRVVVCTESAVYRSSQENKCILFVCLSIRYRHCSLPRSIPSFENLFSSWIALDRVGACWIVNNKHFQSNTFCNCKL